MVGLFLFGIYLLILLFKSWLFDIFLDVNNLV